MAGENQDQSGGEQHTRDKRYECVLRAIDDLIDNHFTRLQRWVTTWDKVDHSHMKRIAESTCETVDGCGTVFTSIPILDAIQSQAEAQISSAIERVEHLVTLCSNKTD